MEELLELGDEKTSDAVRRDESDSVGQPMCRYTEVLQVVVYNCNTCRRVLIVQNQYLL